MNWRDQLDELRKQHDKEKQLKAEQERLEREQAQQERVEKTKGRTSRIVRTLTRSNDHITYSDDGAVAYIDEYAFEIASYSESKTSYGHRERIAIRFYKDGVDDHEHLHLTVDGDPESQSWQDARTATAYVLYTLDQKAEGQLEDGDLMATMPEADEATINAATYVVWPALAQVLSDIQEVCDVNRRFDDGKLLIRNHATNQVIIRTPPGSYEPVVFRWCSNPNDRVFRPGTWMDHLRGIANERRLDRAHEQRRKQIEREARFDPIDDAEIMAMGPLQVERETPPELELLTQLADALALLKDFRTNSDIPF